MNPFEPARKVADAVLYEGYILYPYTASAPKNRIRWQFGVVVPAAYAAQGTGEPSQAQTEVLLECDGSTEVDVLVRFLQVEARQVEAWTQSAFVVVDSLVLASKKYVTFDEGVERELTIHFRPGAEVRTAVPIASPAQESVETLTGEDGAVAGRVVRRRWPLHGAISLESEPVADRAGLRRLRVRIENSSAVVRGERSSALRTAFVSTHTLFHARGGRFLSALDPPDEAREATARLVNRHTWPVLVGDEQPDSQRSPARALVADHSVRLSCRRATERSGYLRRYRGRRADDAERPQPLGSRAGRGPRNRRAGTRNYRASRTFRPRRVGSAARDLASNEARSSGVRSFWGARHSRHGLHLRGRHESKQRVARAAAPQAPCRRRDLFLDGRLATVRAIHQDVENLMYVAVSVDDDPASELHDWYGRSLFFYPDEVEPVGAMAAG